MNYQAATDYLHSLMNLERGSAGIAISRYLNLDRMHAAMAQLGNPHSGLRVAHIAGTKGKGSTATMLAAIGRGAGLRVGLYTSPHLITLRERIRIDDQFISEATFAACMADLVPVAENMRDTPNGPPTYFETLTLLAFLYYARESVDIAVMETGMGGRLDATNICTPCVTGITTIALDHTAELGDTLMAIAGEKAGILKPGVPVVCAPQQPEVATVISRMAAERGCPHYRIGTEIIVTPGTVTPDSQVCTVSGRLGTYPIDLPLRGAHQQRNAAVAVGMAECLLEAGVPITAAAISAGLANVEWPGRLQLLSRHPLLLVDGAHDPAAVEVLLAALDAHFPARPRHFVLGFMADKDWRTMLRHFATQAASLIITTADSPRAVPPEIIAAEAASLGIPHCMAHDVPTALQMASHIGAEDACLCVTGSLYVVGEALAYCASVLR